ncbi:glycosyltransferase family 4 protein [Ruminococcus sp.]|uniref:glycosyltransferase family 4 protein n=1 Tax=Ruminococcus sp. TaxID=41978 RepID=UPI001B755675|nr:glycosyltransferase family 4 protein [Ruminococcus sp.]MBP5432988.1 glycosyltransferase family 4 protein [Ruminococcus sp.]
MKNILFVVRGYPNGNNPEYAFISPIVHAIANQGYNCIVIAPQSINNKKNRQLGTSPNVWNDITDEGQKITIYRPKHLSLSNVRLLGNSLTMILKELSVRKCIKKFKIKADVIYAHFWDCAILSAKCFSNIPIIVASGESQIRVRNYYSNSIIEKYIKNIKGAICVSTKNRKESIELGLLSDKIPSIVLPNAVNSKMFYVCESNIRNKLNISPDTIIAAFVGSFTDRKGIKRVIEAAKGINKLKLFLIGSGEAIQPSEQIAICGPMPHEKISQYLNAADMFVLPTKAEGCCNAIVEALACGLPIISSNLDFNKDILNDTNSILINPNSIIEIHNAMEEMTHNTELRKKLKEGALKTANELHIEPRARSILLFMEKCCMFNDNSNQKEIENDG